MITVLRQCTICKLMLNLSRANYNTRIRHAISRPQYRMCSIALCVIGLAQSHVGSRVHEIETIKDDDYLIVSLEELQLNFKKYQKSFLIHK